MALLINPCMLDSGNLTKFEGSESNILVNTKTSYLAIPYQSVANIIQPYRLAYWPWTFESNSVREPKSPWPYWTTFDAGRGF